MRFWEGRTWGQDWMRDSTLESRMAVSPAQWMWAGWFWWGWLAPTACPGSCGASVDFSEPSCPGYDKFSSCQLLLDKLQASHTTDLPVWGSKESLRWRGTGGAANVVLRHRTSVCRAVWVSCIEHSQVMCKCFWSCCSRQKGQVVSVWLITSKRPSTGALLRWPCWPRPKPGAKNWIWVSPRGGRDPFSWATTCCFQGYILAGS